MAWKLADVFIQFAVKDVEVVANAFKVLQVQLDKITTTANAVGALASSAFNKIAVSLGGWVTAGIAVSSVGQQLAFQTERLARTIAGVFRPEIQKAIDLIRRATETISGLSNEQKANIARWIEAALAGLAVAKIMPLVFSGITTVVAGVKALTAAFLGLDVASGGILPLLGGLVTAVAGLGVMAFTAENGIGGLFNTLKPLWDLLKRATAELLPTITPLFTQLAPLVRVVVEALEPLLPLVAAVNRELVQIATPFLSLALEQAAGAIRSMAQALRFMLEQLRLVTSPLAELVKLAQRLGLLPKTPALALAGLDNKDRSMLPGRFGDFVNDPAEIYWRIASQSVLVGKRPEERAADELEQANRELTRIRRAVERQQPAVV